MKIKHLLLPVLLGVTSYQGLSAQSLNYAVEFNSQQPLRNLALKEMSGLEQYAIQFAIAPEQWSASSLILGSDDNSSLFSVALSATPGEITFTVNNVKHSIGQLSTEGWSQVTIIVDGDKLISSINGKVKESVTTDLALPELSGEMVIGENFDGRIDEFRIWNAALPSANQDEWMLQNTVTKFHPMWDQLLVYYKFDQNLCEDNVVDYKFEHHAYSNGPITKIPVSDNTDLRYRVVSGYSDFNRHCDRLQIDRDMHLMTNDMIMLNAHVDGYTGEISMNASEDATFTEGYAYLDNYAGREGVLSLDGSGVMNAGEYIVMPGSPAGTALSFEGWFNLDEWVEGSYLLKKEENSSSKINILLGSKSKKELIVEVGNWNARFENAYNDAEGNWNHLGFVLNPSTGRNKIRLYVNNKPASSPKIDKPSNESNFEVWGVDSEATIGEGYKGKIDNIIFWRQPRTSFAGTMDETSPELKFPGGGSDAIFLEAYWKFNEKDNLGLNLRGWQGMLQQIKDMYAGHRGYKIRLGLISSTNYSNGGKVWPDNIGRAEWRENLAKGVARIIPFCDGIDVDLEWLDNNPNNPKWTAYGEMVKALRAEIPQEKILSVSLHPVSYTLPKTPEVMDAIDFITFQNYGPRPTSLYYDAYATFFNQAVNYGIPKDKIRLSMATTIVRKDNSAKNVRGYKDIDFTNITAESNETMLAGYEYCFNGVNDVKKKMKLLVDNNTGGCMYFDMGNDVSPQHELSLIRALNSVIASNVDTIVTKVPTVNSIEGITKKKNNFEIFPNPTTNEVTVKGEIEPEGIDYKIMDLNGRLIKQSKVFPEEKTITLNYLSVGTYIMHLFNEEKHQTVKVNKID